MQVYRSFFFLLVFLFCCTQKTDQNHPVEIDNLPEITYLLNHVLFDHHGVFVLFGSKPMSCIELPRGVNPGEAERLFASLPEELRAKAKIVDYPIDYQKTWELWRLHQKDLPCTNLIFSQHHLKSDPSAIVVTLSNVKTLSQVLEKHRNIFTQVIGSEFNIQAEIENLRNGGSPFWDRVLSDVLCQGLLYGYGEKNSRLFTQTLKEKRSWEKMPFSATSIEPYEATAQNFTIPLFRTVENDENVKRYQTEKKRIEKIFRRGSVFRIMMNCLEN